MVERRSMYDDSSEGAVVKKRFAHNAGRTSLVYSHDGRIVTAGEEGEVRLFNDIDDENAEVLDVHDTPITALAVVNNHIITGATDGHVKVHQYPTGDLMDLLTRFTLPIEHISVSYEGNMAAVSSEEHEIRVVSVSNPSEVIHLHGHEGVVKSLAIDPCGVYLASIACDGYLRIWLLINRAHRDGNDAKDNYEDDEDCDELGTCVRAMCISERDNRTVSTDLQRMSWHPKGSVLAVPVGDEIIVYERDSWKSLFTLKEDGIELFTSAAWSPSGAYCATACVDGSVHIWNMAKRDTISRKKDGDSSISALTWHPKDNCLAWADLYGEVHEWYMAVPSSLPPPGLIGSDGGPSLTLTHIKGDNTLNDVSIVADVNEDDGDNKYLDGIDMSDVGSFIDDDASDIANSFDKSATKHKSLALTSKADLQPAFQSGSTPFSSHTGSSNVRRRFLCWTGLGSVMSCMESDDFASIDIEFHDVSVMKPTHLNDHYKFTMAALSKRGVLLACPARKKSASTVFFRAFNSWALNSDWTVSMENGESVVAVALSPFAVVVATDRLMLRFFSLSGIQTSIISLSGPVVTMATEDRELAVVIQSGPPFAGSQPLALLRIAVQDYSISGNGNPIPLPISPRSELTWLGYSETGALATCDSLGIVRLALHCRQYFWTPVADLVKERSNESDHHWIVGVTSAEILFIRCKGNQKYPKVLPRPVMDTSPFRLPTLASSRCTAEGYIDHEEAQLRLALFNEEADMCTSSFSNDPLSVAKRQATRDSSLLSLIQVACREDRAMRALSLCTQLSLKKSFPIATKLAMHFKQTTLAEKMNLVALAKVSQAEADAAASEVSDSQDDDTTIDIETTTNALKRNETQMSDTKQNVNTLRHDDIENTITPEMEVSSMGVASIYDDESGEIVGDQTAEKSNRETEKIQLRHLNHPVKARINPFAKPESIQHTTTAVRKSTMESSSFFDTLNKTIVSPSPKKKRSTAALSTYELGATDSKNGKKRKGGTDNKRKVKQRTLFGLVTTPVEESKENTGQSNQ